MQTSYQTIAAKVEERIAAGEFRAGAPIPSVRALAEEYGVAPLTARRAISRLCQSGKLRAVNGVGTFVREGCPLRDVTLVIGHLSRQAASDAGHPLAALLEGTQEACRKAGVPLVLATDLDDPARYIGRGSGFIVFPPRHNGGEMTRWVGALRASRDPAVSVAFDVGMDNSVMRDTEAGVAKGLRYLHGLGHRRVMILTRVSLAGPPVLCVPPGFHAPGLETRLHAIEYKEQSLAARMWEDYEALDAIFDGAWTPTALLAGTGVVVDHVMQYLADRGARVPGEISVMGYCLEAHGWWNERPITRLDLGHRVVGKTCVEELIKMACGGGYRTGHKLIHPELIYGDTCASAPPAPIA
ncbi:MAG TPA: GntR family transcriptional regulator, partial [Candidatus Brocadiia bacterium]|nr:GntR family transcriptional regulator [Candidatus Brocadiia bacterium]